MCRKMNLPESPLHLGVIHARVIREVKAEFLVLCPDPTKAQIREIAASAWGLACMQRHAGHHIKRPHGHPSCGGLTSRHFLACIRTRGTLRVPPCAGAQAAWPTQQARWSESE